MSRSCIASLLVVLASLASAGQAQATTASAAWSIDTLSSPSDFSTADNAHCEAFPATQAFEYCDTYAVTATDVGSLPVQNGAPVVKMTDTLPPGVAARNVSLFLEDVPGHQNQDISSFEGTKCTTAATPPITATCEIPTTLLGFGKNLLEPDGKVIKIGGTAEHPKKVSTDQSLKMLVSVTVPEPVTANPKLENAVSVSGGITGGSHEATAIGVNTLQSGPPGFGPNLFDASFLGIDGRPETQAGGHPYQLNTRIDLNSKIRESPEGFAVPTTVQDVRDVLVDLPLGMAGSGVSAPQCTLARLASKGEEGIQAQSGCPANTIIGHVRTSPESNVSADNPVYNLLPEKGVAAELGFIDLTGGTHVLYVGLAPTPSGYVVRTTGREIPQLALNEILVNVFGNPAIRDESSESAPSTFTNPSDCTGEELKTRILMDSWQAPGSYNADGTPDLSDPNWKQAEYRSPAVTGCEQLKGLFEPVIVAAPSTHKTSSPSGLDVTLSVPQRTGPEGQATPPLRDTTITLPEGISVNPSSANGLQACSLEQVGIKKVAEKVYVPDAAPVRCPSASKIGTVELETPALAMQQCKRGEVPLQECPAGEREPAPLTGAIYVAKEGEFEESLLAIYIVIEDARTGVIAKLPAKVTAAKGTGQLTTTVTDSPQFPFSVLRTHFFHGASAALSTPATCGTYTVTSQLTPWSAPESGLPATPSSSFEINQGPDGGPCSSPGFAPTFNAGAASTQAGAYSPFSVTFSRQDGEQYLSGTAVTTPPGLLGTIRDVPLCPEPQASRGECSPESELGEVTTAVGSGPQPYWVTGGRAYLTGPYNGGPFGLSIVVPTTAGPYTLEGNAGPGMEVVRASIRVNPHTAQITVVSDPLPPELQGIPLQIRTVHVTINRSTFMFNPTNCGELSSQATFTSTQGAIASASAPFFASNCGSLPFHPVLTASSQANTSKLNGASLTVHVNAAADEAHISRTDLQLPVQLPSRLETLQKACLAKQFEENPAGCPAGSDIGTAVVETPILKNALTGPIYLVSFGGGEFPHTEIVLQGEGVTTILDGHTDIKKGITYSNFEAVPDVPFTSFQANLPEGPHSVLGAHLPENAHGSLCGLGLKIPTLIAAQNGRQLKQETLIHVTGCPNVPTVRAVARHRRGRRRKLTLTVYTPATGVLRVSGKGIRAVSRRVKSESISTLTVASRRRGRTRLVLSLKPTGKGRIETAHVLVQF